MSTGAIPCESWTPIWTCTNLTGNDLMPSGTAVEIATEILYNMSGQRFGICTFEIRPCRQSCGSGAGAGFGSWNGQWWEWGGQWPRPALIDGAWYNLTCGGCSGTCSCTTISEAWLPSPVHSIVSVDLDGTELTLDVDYRVDDFRKLVRLGGEAWPYCQDMNAAPGEADTWTVTVEIGEEVPALGRLAVGELACYLMSDECAIPRTATTVTRQGITIELPTVQEMLREGFLGFKWVDTFIATYNPQRLKAVPMVFDVDGERFRRTGTS